MDVFSLIFESLQIVYSIIPKELFIIVVGSIIASLILTKKDKNADY